MSHFPIIFFQTNSGKHPAKKFINTLDKRELAKVVNALKALGKYGNMLGMPHVRHLIGKLSELRIRGRQEIRLIFVIIDNQIVILHGFIKKTNQTPDREIDISLERFTLTIQRLQ